MGFALQNDNVYYNKLHGYGGGNELRLFKYKINSFQLTRKISNGIKITFYRNILNVQQNKVNGRY